MPSKWFEFFTRLKLYNSMWAHSFQFASISQVLFSNWRVATGLTPLVLDLGPVFKNKRHFFIGQRP